MEETTIPSKVNGFSGSVLSQITTTMETNVTINHQQIERRDNMRLSRPNFYHNEVTKIINHANVGN